MIEIEIEIVQFHFVANPFCIGHRFTSALLNYPTLEVEKMHFLTTEARATDGRLFVIPNSALYSNGIIQYKRTSIYALDIYWWVSFSTRRQVVIALHVERVCVCVRVHLY